MSVYPACAGIDLVFVDIVEVGECLPRMRGDRPADQAQIAFLAEFTPHARGSTLSTNLTYISVYPAYLRIDPQTGFRNLPPGGLPPRGDRPRLDSIAEYLTSLPRMRGDRPG